MAGDSEAGSVDPKMRVAAPARQSGRPGMDPAGRPFIVDGMRDPHPRTSYPVLRTGGYGTVMVWIIPCMKCGLPSPLSGMKQIST